MYNYIKSAGFNLESAMIFINDGNYEIISVTQDDWEYTIFYKDNKKTW